MKLYKFYWDCGSMGSVEGVFVADPADVEKAIGQGVYFGEILGKHSEVYGTLKTNDVTVIDESEEFITKFQEIFPHGVGHNPMYYVTRYCEDCGEPIEDGEVGCWRCE